MFLGFQEGQRDICPVVRTRSVGVFGARDFHVESIERRRIPRKTGWYKRLERRFGQREGAACAVHPCRREVNLVGEPVHEHYRGVVAPVVGVREPIAAVDFIELPLSPAQGVPNPSSGAALLFLKEEFKTVSGPDALCDLLLPVGIDRVAETRALPVAQQAVHGFVIALDAAFDFSERLGPSRRPLLARLGVHLVRRRHPQVSGEGEAFVGQEVDKLVHAGVGGLDCPSVPQAVIEGDPRLQRGEGCAIDLEPRTVESDVRAEPVGEVHLILDVEELFRRPHLFCPKGCVDAGEILAKFRLERRGPRIEPVQGQVAAEAQVVRVIERIIKSMRAA